MADFAEVVAVGLEAGLDLPAAALAAARSPGVERSAPWLLDRLVAAVADGRGVSGLLGPGLDVDLHERVRADLTLLVAAWRLAEDVGAGAARATASAAASVRDQQAAAEHAAAVVAGPRASMVLLSVLPLAGPAAAALVGVSPARLYGSVPAQGLAATGLVLTGAGWWWSRTLLHRSRRPGRTSRPGMRAHRGAHADE